MCTAFEEIKKGYIELRDTTHWVGTLMYDPDDDEQRQFLIDEGRKGLKEATEETAKLEQLCETHLLLQSFR